MSISVASLEHEDTKESLKDSLQILEHPQFVMVGGKILTKAPELVGIDNIPERVIDTVKSIGKDVVGRPQLMSTASVSAGIGAYVTRRLFLGNLKSGRYLLSLDDIFDLSQDL